MQEVSSAYGGLKLGRHAAAAGSAGHVFAYDAAGTSDGADSGAGTSWAAGISSACRQLQYSLLQPCAPRPSRWEPGTKSALPSKAQGTGRQLALSARRLGLDELAVNLPVVYVVCPSAYPDAPVVALLQCARALRLGSDALHQTAAGDQGKAMLLQGGLCATAQVSSTAKQQQLQAPEASPAQPRGSASQDCDGTHAGAGDSRRPGACRAADDEPWLTLQVCSC